MNLFSKFVNRLGLVGTPRPGFPPTAPRPSPIFVDPDNIEEQITPQYCAQRFYPVRLGEVINDKYHIVSKLGFGTSSTVWLAWDVQRKWWQTQQWVTIKMLTRSASGKSTAETELEVSRLVLQANPLCEGRQYLRTVIDSFEVTGPHGLHTGLVYETMRESLKTFQRRHRERRISESLLKALLEPVLHGLDYLHSECNIIHTDLKPDNILLGVESRHAIEEVVQAEIDEPTPYKVEDDRAIYCSRNFGCLRGIPGKPKLSDFGLAVRGDELPLHFHPIQPNRYQAPEVILGLGWTYSADVWNLGVMLWDMIENTSLFDAETAEGDYSVQRHLEEMSFLLGPPPEDMVNRGDIAPRYFSSEGGEILQHNCEPARGASLEASLTAFSGEGKPQYLRFVRRMLQWRPEDRATARELLKDPWLAR